MHAFIRDSNRLLNLMLLLVHCACLLRSSTVLAYAQTRGNQHHRLVQFASTRLGLAPLSQSIDLFVFLLQLFHLIFFQLVLPHLLVGIVRVHLLLQAILVIKRP